MKIDSEFNEDSSYLSSRCLIGFERAFQDFAQFESVTLRKASQAVVEFHAYPGCKLDSAPGLPQAAAVDADPPLKPLRRPG
jgi:hypothetical protein